ncbi:hypothetical protein pdam_00019852 [Pocillopora damicornis]|uniref:Uncharacterized protein n=1 Tax=Pocillopora damicornis TaxID=46731 RepID=A0A3M6TKD9_POCDA|nr:hypothetical protein pdam_00019852 [Pocillopora damicornis]
MADKLMARKAKQIERHSTHSRLVKQVPDGSSNYLEWILKHGCHSNSWEHGGATREHSVSVQVLTDVNITLHDRVISGLMDTSRFHSKEGWLEHGLWSTESLVSDGDNLSIRKFIALLQAGA